MEAAAARRTNARRVIWLVVALVVVGLTALSDDVRAVTECAPSPTTTTPTSSTTSSTTTTTEVVMMARPSALASSDPKAPPPAGSRRANVAPGAVGVHNNRLAVQVAGDGTFNLGACPNATGDANPDSWDLMYRWPQLPWSSITSVRIDGTGYVLNFTGAVTEAPTVADPNTVRTRMKIGDIEVTQVLQLADNPGTGQQDILRITYEVRNTGSTPHTVGTRMLIDTEVNYNDGAVMRVPGIGKLQNETEFIGVDVPTTFQAFASLSDSTHVAAGQLRGSNATPPDRLVFANWGAIHQTVYDYPVASGVPLGGDTAYAAYWSPVSIAPGSSQTYVTYYGIAELDVDLNGPLAIGVTGPAALSVVQEQYSPDPFDVVATVFNTDSVAHTGVHVTLSLPEGLSLVDGSLDQAIGTLASGAEAQRSWRVHAQAQPAPKTLKYTVTVSADDVAPRSVSRTVSVPLLKVTPVLALTSSANPSTFGQPVTLTATLAESSAGAPTGTVTFRDGSVVLGDAPVDPSGVARLTTTSLGGGSHSLTASYSGDAAFFPSTGSLTQLVNPAATTTALSSSANPSTFGQPVTLTASVASPAGVPTGSVEFRDGNAVLGVVPLSGGVASFTTSALGVGPHSLIAAYSGAPDFLPSSISLSQTVDKVPSSTAVVASPNPSVYGGTVTLTATVTSSAPVVPTGAVTFRDGSTVLGQVPLDPNGHAGFATASLTPGTHAITASYGGDAVTLPSTGSTSLTVERAPTSVALTWTSDFLATAGMPIVFTAKVTTTGPGTPTGTVVFREGDVVLGEATLDPSGTAVLSTSALGVGPHTVTAEYQGDASFQPGHGSVALTVNKGLTSVGVTASPEPSAFGQDVTLTATVSSLAPGTPTGKVTFSNGSTVLGEAEVVSGTASFTTSALPVGTQTVTATYSGDALFEASSGTVSHVVAKAGSKVTVASSANPSVVGQPVTFTATLTPGSAAGGTPTGKVTFKEGETSLGEATLDASGQATLTLANLAGGTHTVTAAYGGDASFDASAASITQEVNKAASTTAMTSSANPAGVGQEVTIVATVNSTAGMPTGTVTFREGATVLGQTPIASGKATFTTATLGPGTHTITAAYGGDGSFMASTAELSQVIANPAAAPPAAAPATPGPSAAPSPSPSPTTTPTTTTTTPSAPAPAPTGAAISVFPAVTSVNRMVQVSGTGFGPRAEITLRWPSAVPGESGPVSTVVTADADGRFGPISVTVPSDGAGPRSLTATGSTGATASTSLLVTLGTAQPGGAGFIFTTREKLINRR